MTPFREELADITQHLRERDVRLARLWVGRDLEIRVLSVVKGGLRVAAAGLEAFLPGSQIGEPLRGDRERHVGQRWVARVIKINARRGVLVVSRRAVLECSAGAVDPLAPSEETLERLSLERIEGCLRAVIASPGEAARIMDIPTTPESLRVMLFRAWRQAQPLEVARWCAARPIETLVEEAARERLQIYTYDVTTASALRDLRWALHREQSPRIQASAIRILGLHAESTPLWEEPLRALALRERPDNAHLYAVLALAREGEAWAEHVLLHNDSVLALRCLALLDAPRFKTHLLDVLKQPLSTRRHFVYTAARILAAHFGDAECRSAVEGVRARAGGEIVEGVLEGWGRP